MIKKINTKLYFYFLSSFVILIDQFSKYIISKNYNIFVNKDFILFKIDFVKNYGAAFNIFNGSRIFLCFISVIFSIILIYLILRKNSSNHYELYSYAFILGGTVGNGIDRIINGFVIDFINLNIINFPVFNIANISINVGFIVSLIRTIKKQLIL